MRRRLALLVSATTALLLIAFVIPLAILVRVLVSDRAIASATSEAQQISAIVATTTSRAALTSSVAQLTQAAGHPATVFLPDGTAIPAPARRTPAVQLSELGQSMSVSDPGGREILVAVQGLPGGGTAVVRTFVSNAELSQGVTAQPGDRGGV
jgi:glucose/arabinose dehydrogenase